MNENLEIRTADLSDMKAIMEIEYACFDPGVIESKEVFESRIRQFPEGFLFALDNVGRRGIAYLSSERWERQGDRRYDFSLDQQIGKKHSPTGPVFYISSMGVLPNYRRRGIGQEMFGRSLQLAQSLGCTEAILIVGETWIHAHPIYVKQGFTELYRIEDFFTPESKPAYDAIVMWRRL
ncbi:MAG: N-acetyltransferase [Dehalococcoidia bacterium]|nr:N-acetyltransferase [Dehalococcoidia bacterium]